MSDPKSYESRGMPMRTKEQFGGGRPDNKYSVYCTDAAGTLKPYDVVLENMKNFVIRTMGVSEQEALMTAQEGMSKLPAWKDSGRGAA